ncbi:MULTISPECIES: CYTH domain-containing protein [Rhodanobacter]|uniref:CYTH domain-containing protein n=1 Tax=Rhodanobacter TaxID=75309 RepID=UPI000482CE8A|nr:MULTISPECIES: CYTH domain-containing protein [Rhodanobacter]KZC19713.1 CYTH domain protein [Rhodanobacter denitrificans]UJJ49525.1 CYTH domain-containing protein [Rhodanobacter denitrificans]UJJ58273.1 CYTH domain-containing protein [Rhodanobacter denitrificans]UJM88767.1 CYTH domain-containing protein [Rhodanobacter denitrificans]UJM92239.1 CYTH domain-containing protein [Rhodanobacter denitrificans]
MPVEIERKFLLRDDSWHAQVERSEPMAQGYLVDAQALRAGLAHASVRVRVAGARAWLNIKAATLAIARAEFEYPIPPDEAQTMLVTLCNGVLEKTRHHVRVDGTLFEVDEFAGDNAGLVVAEVELPAVDAPFPRPPWLGREVSALARYYNVNLIAHPYRQWSLAERAAEDAAC